MKKVTYAILLLVILGLMSFGHSTRYTEDASDNGSSSGSGGGGVNSWDTGGPYGGGPF